jgi:hypothetical protein
MSVQLTSTPQLPRTPATSSSASSSTSPASPTPADAAVTVAPTKPAEPAAVFEGAKAAVVVAAAPAVATPVEVAEHYFAALNARDQPALNALYAKDARFDDNVFHFKSSAGILGMWNKLPADARVQHEVVAVDGNGAGKAVVGLHAGGQEGAQR